MNRSPVRFVTAATAAALLLLASPGLPATFVLNVLDGPGEGFNDPTPVAPVGGNPGTTLGQQRINVFETAGLIWGTHLQSDVTIVVNARFDPQFCDAGSAVLGSAGAITVASDFTGAPVSDTWYPIALANKLAGEDLTPGTSDINATFNLTLDGGTCLGGARWYYGYDHAHGLDLDLLPTVLHEIGHGLGFQTFTTLSTGQFLNQRTDIYARHLFDRTRGEFWHQMTNIQRKNSAVNTGQLVWGGAFVQAAAPRILAPGIILRIDSPPAIAGNKEFARAEFGPPPPDPPIQAEVILVDDGAGTTSDGCEPIVNGALVAGKIALIDRGICTFVDKAVQAQAAGAVAVIIANNVSGPPQPMSGIDPSITIPVVGITLDDANAIKANLGGGVFATIGSDPSQLTGADLQGRPLLYAPNPLEQGSSVSHWDETAVPNLLMEPFLNDDDTKDVDLTQYLYADIGWYATATGVEVASSPLARRTSSAPNPFSSATSLRFQRSRSGGTVVEVFDTRGALVRRWPASWRAAGPHSIDWNGTDHMGRRVPAGVYYWRVRGTGEIQGGRVVRVE
ncbi:MAG TPA: PA domain-containing protein [Candidatus Eisenbacteria bacterium]|nr:PA domain-containing protein [Candidatus Eisenbacteria bacterium]